MAEATFGASDYAGTGPENYQKYFVPVIGAPMAADLIEAASLRPGERVLDVACGTGVVTRLAAKEVGNSGAVAGLDVNPGMLAVARAATSKDLAVDWHASSAEDIALPDDSFDVVLCQMGLQFIPNRRQVLEEIRRVLKPGGRIVMNLPGPIPKMFAQLADGLARHIDSNCAGFVNVVFSVYDSDEVRDLLTGAGFQNVQVDRTKIRLRLPEAEAFLWQYIHSTPLAGLVGEATEPQRANLANEIK